MNYVDLSPHYAGVFFSVGNTFGNLSGIFAPMVAGIILGDADTAGRKEWQYVFYLTALIYGVTLVLWFMFSKAKPQQALN